MDTAFWVLFAALLALALLSRREWAAVAGMAAGAALALLGLAAAMPVRTIALALLAPCALALLRAKQGGSGK